MQWVFSKELGRNITGYQLQHAIIKKSEATSYTEMFLMVVNLYQSALID